MPPEALAARLAHRGFPAPEWAWPTGSRDLLLRAALLPDPGEARAALRAWLTTHDLDEISFADHRLMAAVAERHGADLASAPEYPRLKGLQRQLWTRSRLSLDASRSAVQAFVAAGLSPLLLKGAARIALDPTTQRQRAQHDVDLLLRPEELVPAAHVLVDAGWATIYGDSRLAAVARARVARAINFVLLPWGNLDLHRSPYHGRQVNTHLDARIWSDAQSAEFFGVPVLVPCAAERLAMCLAHGVTYPETHSDWLVDAADIIAGGDMDWERARDVFVRRRMTTEALVALSYLHEGLGIALPPSALSALSTLTLDPLPYRLATLLLARPAEATRPWFERLPRRALTSARYWQPQLRRLWLLKGGSSRDDSGEPLPTMSAAIARTANRPALGSQRPSPASSLPDQTAHATHYTTTVVLQAPRTAAPTAATHVDISVTFKAPGVRRRVILELNSETVHLARFHVFVFGGTNGVLHARLQARVRLPAGCRALTLEARPRRFPLPTAQPTQLRKAEPVPFVVISSTLAVHQPTEPR